MVLINSRPTVGLQRSTNSGDLPLRASQTSRASNLSIGVGKGHYCRIVRRRGFEESAKSCKVSLTDARE